MILIITIIFLYYTNQLVLITNTDISLWDKNWTFINNLSSFYSSYLLVNVKAGNLERWVGCLHKTSKFRDRYWSHTSHHCQCFHLYAARIGGTKSGKLQTKRSPFSPPPPPPPSRKSFLPWLPLSSSLLLLLTSVTLVIRHTAITFEERCEMIS